MQTGHTRFVLYLVSKDANSNYNSYDEENASCKRHPQQSPMKS